MRSELMHAPVAAGMRLVLLQCTRKVDIQAWLQLGTDPEQNAHVCQLVGMRTSIVLLL